jgi:uncharacterized membrane protein YuzA (DUF378 family)
MENLGTIVLAVGALGTASFGIVEALKWTFIGLFGYGQIGTILGMPVFAALRVAYGPQAEALLKAQYRAGRMSGELPTTIRQGVRVGLTPSTAGDLAKSLGVVDEAALREVATLVQNGTELNDSQRGVLGRFELALDARIDAALALADSRYTGYIRLVASFVAIAIALAVGALQGASMLTAFIVGLAAVPVAPVAKDLANALQSAATALKRTGK